MTRSSHLLLNATCVTALSLAAASFAGAQTIPTGSGYTIKAGLLFPSGGSTITTPPGGTETVKPRITMLGISEDVGRTAAVSSLSYGYYADYFAQGSKSTTENLSLVTTAKATGKASGYAIGIQAKTGSSTGSSYSPYAGAGVGYYNLKASLDGFDETGKAGTFSASKSTIGGKAFVGIQTKSGLLGELEYEYIPEVDTKFASGATAYKSKLTGFGVSIGFKL